MATRDRRRQSAVCDQYELASYAFTTFDRGHALNQSRLEQDGASVRCGAQCSRSILMRRPSSVIEHAQGEEGMVNQSDRTDAVIRTDLSGVNPFARVYRPQCDAVAVHCAEVGAQRKLRLTLFALALGSFCIGTS